MKEEQLLQQWKREEQEPFAGWDFAHLRGRMKEDPLPWDYRARACELMRGAVAMLDMDTGGGEVLLSMRESWPPRVEVTEGYPPNVQLVRQRLGPLGLVVHDMDVGNEMPMPLASRAYDLVLNRHGAFNPAEIARILRPDGVFLTQQVHGLWAEDLLAAFGARPQYPDARAEYYGPRLIAAGFSVTEVREHAGELTFSDVGAVVYYLKAAPWLVPGFAVEGHLNALMTLQGRLEREGMLVFKSRHYLIEARLACVV